jgi:Uma2 family endonuclease
MRAVWLQPDREWLEERRKRGLDHRDEVWDGVLHVVPQPNYAHQQLGSDLLRTLGLVADKLGFNVLYELGTYDPIKGEQNYRVPDLVVVDPQYASKRGLEGRAELVVEILSPNDESRDKFDFYAMCRVQEVWIADPATRVVEVYVLRGDRYFMVAPDRSGVVHAPRFGLELEVVPGPKLKLSWADGSAEI